MYKCEATNKCKELGSGCSTDGRAVASGARDTQFEATLMRHFWTFFINFIVPKNVNKENEAKIARFKNILFHKLLEICGRCPKQDIVEGKEVRRSELAELAVPLKKYRLKKWAIKFKLSNVSCGPLWLLA